MGSLRRKKDHCELGRGASSLLRKDVDAARLNRVVLLGAGESGKTTLLNNILYKKVGDEVLSLDQSARRHWFNKDILEGTAAVLRILRTSGGVPKQDAEFEDASELIETLVKTHALEHKDQTDGIRSDNEFLDDDCVDALKYLWSLENFREAIEITEGQDEPMRNNYAYMMSKLVSHYPVWGGRGWKLDIDDILRIRAPTTNIVRVSVHHNDQEILFTDVGGQREQRQNWKAASEGGVDTIVFCIASTQFDEKVFESKMKNRLDESLDLFQGLLDGKLTVKLSNNCRLFLVFSKIDLFTDKMSKRSVQNLIELPPNAPTTNKDFHRGLEYIKQLFVTKAEASKHDVHVYSLNCTSFEDGPLDELLDDLAPFREE